MSNDALSQVLMIVLGIMIFILMILITIFLVLRTKEKIRENNDKNKDELLGKKSKNQKNTTKQAIDTSYTKE